MSDHDRFCMGGIVNKQIAALVVATVVLTAVTLADAQQRTKIPKIGWLGIRPDSLTTSVESFRREFYALGHVEGKSFTLEYRSAANKLDRLPSLANELIVLKVDLLIAPSTNEARAAKNATKTIPIVFSSNDPVGSGLVDSLARPGGNLTGFSTIASGGAGRETARMGAQGNDSQARPRRVSVESTDFVSSVEGNSAARKRTWLAAPSDGGQQRGQDR